MDIRRALLSDPKNMAITALVAILILMLLGINVFIVIGNIMEVLVAAFGPLVAYIIRSVGYIIGTIITQVAALFGNVGRLGITAVEQTAKTAGNVIQNVSGGAVMENMATEPEPTYTANPIMQKEAKGGYCYVGDNDGQRGCVEVDDPAMCMSGQIFPERETCLNATMTPNDPKLHRL